MIGVGKEGRGCNFGGGFLAFDLLHDNNMINDCTRKYSQMLRRIRWAI